MWMRSAIGAAALAAGFGLAPAMAAGGEGAERAATPPTTLGLTYTLYLAGITLGEITLDAEIRGGEYFAVSTMKTAGIAESLYEAKIEADSSGALSDAALAPLAYNSIYRAADGKPQITNVRFAPDGEHMIVADPAIPPNRVPVTRDQKLGAVDPVAAMVEIASGVSAEGAAPCGRGARVFDGRRRYDLRFAFVESTTVDYGSGYRGPALRCTLTYDQIAGHKPNINQGNPFPEIKTWLAPIAPSEGAQPFLVPVRFAAETPLGLAVALATRFEVRGPERRAAAE